MGKRKSHSSAAQAVSSSTQPASAPAPQNDEGPPAKRRASQRIVTQRSSDGPVVVDPGRNTDVLDGAEAWRASPDADGRNERMDVENAGMNAAKQIKSEDEEPYSLANGDDSDSPLSDISDIESPIKKGTIKKIKNESGLVAEAASGRRGLGKEASLHTPGNKTGITTMPQFLDPEADGEEEPDEEELQAALSRPPPVNSDYLPLPWRGRLGYACLNTYLRFSNPPVFSSRTCRIASILENRHPLRDPNDPAHATKNRPDREQPASLERGQKFVESLGLANARDIPKMLRWNDRYGIKFLRLSSEMFPFASHEEYGYRLAPFASEALAEAGSVAAELGHRLTTHPGQFTQLGSPRKQVIDNAMRDLEYHAELLSLLKLPPQQNRDAVMILHLGGVFGDKAATLDRFRANYKRLSQAVQNRLVLENDDVSWSVHELLPICEELNIPMVLDYHHHNIIFDAGQIREGTKDIMELYPRILATWERKKITPKMHYSEPTPSAITGRQRRKHNPRVAALPPCPPTMDLMIEAKDKEQAVFELMRTYKLPGFDTFNDIIPHARKDDNKPIRTPSSKKPSRKTPTKQVKSDKHDNDNDLETPPEDDKKDSQPPTQSVLIPADEIGMGGPEGRVYWPPGMEHWLRPMKKIVKPKPKPSTNGMSENLTATTPVKAARKRKAATAAAAAEVAIKLEDEVHYNGKADDSIPTTTTTKAAPTKTIIAKEKKKKKPTKAAAAAKSAPTPSSISAADNNPAFADATNMPKKPKEPQPGPGAIAGRQRRTRSTKKEEED